MKIFHISCEFGPLIKVGGLGEVVYSLSKALLKLNHDIEVILPYSPKLFLEDISLDQSSFFSKENSNLSSKITVFQGIFQNIHLTFLTSEEMFPLFNRSSLYGYDDDIYRFITFCKTTEQYLIKKSKITDIVHLHDWHTAFLSALIKCSNLLSSLPSVLTVHSFAYQGFCPSLTLKKISLNKKFLEKFFLEKDNNYASLLKGGIYFSDYVTTVSPSYAKEMLYTNVDEEIQKSLFLMKNKFKGILNGIDTDYWNPQTDNFLYKKYSPLKKNNLWDFISAKESNKQYLRKKLNLSEGNYPLVIVISRLVKEKGLDFIISSITEIIQKGGQIIILGLCFEANILQKFSLLKRAFHSSQFIHISLKFSEPLAHLLYAAADIILIPSLTEPCGLTQLIAMRYGTLPLVRNIGGLSDTVIAYKTGFVFHENSIKSFFQSLNEALDMCLKKPSLWWEMIQNAMAYNSNWNLSANKYEKIYRRIIKLN